MDDLNGAIDLLREAHQITPAEYVNRQIEISVNLAMRLFQRFELADINSEVEKNLNEAIDVATSALDSTPDDHTVRAHLQNFLGLFHYARSQRSQSELDVRTALKHLWTALKSGSYPSVFRRVQAGRVILHLCCTTSQWKAAYAAAVAALPLIPKLSSRAIYNSDKQRLLSVHEVVGFGADGAAAALNAGEDGYAALRLLEMGRGSLAASVTELRPDPAALDREHPEQA